MFDIIKENMIDQMYLELIEKDEKGYVFRCPICGDSQTKEDARRGHFVIEWDYGFYCYRCNEAMSFESFLYIEYRDLYKQYMQEKKGEKFKKFIEKKPITNNDKSVEKKYEIKFFKEFNKNIFVPAYEHVESLKYCMKRKLPDNVIKKLYYCKANWSLKFPFGQMLIFPFYAKGKGIYGFQGRSITQKRFYIKSPENFKVYNFFNINIERPVYILESIIDSSFVENSISMLGASIPDYILNKIKKPIFVYDNDSVGLLKSLERAKQGYEVFIWPNHLNDIKDINELVLKKNLQQQDVKKFILGNIFKGFTAISKIRLKQNNYNFRTIKVENKKNPFDKFKRKYANKKK